MKLIFISPCYNVSSNLKTLIDSTKGQTSDQWHHFLIDDISSDNSADMMKEMVENDDRYTVIINEQKKYALRNIIDVARTYQDHDDIIIGVIDGDDSLCNNDTVSLTLDAYEKGSDIVWTGHRWDVNSLNISRQMPLNVNPYQWPWCTSHFRTFRASLLKNVIDKNFIDANGQWFERGYDQALMLPLLCLTKNRRYIDEICYLYNIDSSSIPKDKRNWHEMKQISTINFVRARGFLK